MLVEVFIQQPDRVFCLAPVNHAIEDCEIILTVKEQGILVLAFEDA
jgi:hypothetical protein